MASMAMSANTGKNKKLNIYSLGALTTVDAFECVSDCESEVDTISDVGSESQVRSERAQPTETSESDLDGLEDERSAGLKGLLESLGFEESSTDEPLLPVHCPDSRSVAVPGPPQYPDLFWQNFIASRKIPGKLTFDGLADHNEGYDNTSPSSKDTSESSMGAWLGHFKLHAQSVPVRNLANHIFGSDIGSDVACFVGAERPNTLSECCASNPDLLDALNGHRVIGSTFKKLPVSTNQGRSAFIFEDDISVTTPDEAWPEFADWEEEDACIGEMAQASGRLQDMAFGGAL